MTQAADEHLLELLRVFKNTPADLDANRLGQLGPGQPPAQPRTAPGIARADGRGPERPSAGPDAGPQRLVADRRRPVLPPTRPVLACRTRAARAALDTELGPGRAYPRVHFDSPFTLTYFVTMPDAPFACDVAYFRDQPEPATVAYEISLRRAAARPDPRP
jgi:hypothetical protein